jgi:hypothetical protein
VQSGSYLGEDDIVRFEDTYGRSWKYWDIVDLTVNGQAVPGFSYP